MHFLLAKIMTPPNHTLVKKSTGRFGALQMRKVLFSVLTNHEKTTGKDFGKVYSLVTIYRYVEI